MQDEPPQDVRHAAAVNALEEHLAVFARGRLRNWRSQASIAREIEAALQIAHIALSRVTAEWNSQHDRLRRLPLELVLHCWSFLDTRELVRATSVCLEWRRILLDAPALWSNLDFHVRAANHYEQLDVLLQRSKNLRLSLTVRMGDDLAHHLCAPLRGHAHRLYRLDLLEPYSLRPYADYHYGLYASTSPCLLLDFECPILHSFTSEVSSFAFSPSTFRGCPPALQHVRFQYPPTIRGQDPPKFYSVTSLELTLQSPRIPLIASFPCLVRLELDLGYPFYESVPHSNPQQQPMLPATLQHVIINRVEGSYKAISHFGFTRVRLLEIRGCAFGGLPNVFSDLGGVPYAASIQGCLVTLSCESRAADEGGPSPRTASVSSTAYGDGHTRVLEIPSICDNIRSLSFFVGYYPGDAPPALPTLEFPTLETLVLPIDSVDTGVRHPMLHLGAMQACGTLRAPNLRRLVISRVSGCTGRPSEPIRIAPANLTLFITHHLELAPGQVLDEVVLEKGRVMLEEKTEGYAHDLEVLESFVGTVLVTSTDSIDTLASHL